MNSKYPTASVADIAKKIAIGPFGSRMKSDCYVPSGVPVIRGTNLTGGRSFSGDWVFVSDKTADELANCCVSDGDLVFPHRGSIGEVGIVTDEFPRYVMSSSLMKLTCDLAKAHPLYIYYFFKSKQGKHELLKNASQVGTPGIGQPLTSLKGIEIPLPPLPDQHFIASNLGSLDNKIELNRQINQSLEEMAQVIFKSWFVEFEPVKAKIEAKVKGHDPERAAMCTISGKTDTELDQLPTEQRQQLASTAALFPDELEETKWGLIPKGWGCNKLGDFVNVVDFVTNGSFASLKENVQLLDVPGYALFVRTTDFNSGFSGNFRFVNKSAYDFLKKSSLDGSEVIISNVGDVGTVFRAPKWLGYPMTLGSNAVALKSNLANSYLFHFFRGYEGQHAIQSIVTGSAQLKFNKTNLRDLEILLPSDSILKQFSCVSNGIQDQQDNLELQIRSLTALRDTLLPKLLSGEIEVNQMV